jgi:hypothetical protein
MINLESFKLIDLTMFHSEAAILAFILCASFIMRLNAPKIILSLLTLSAMIIMPSPLYLFILSLISLIQAWDLINRGRRSTAYKYFAYSFLFVFMNIPVIAGYYTLLVTSIFMIKAVISSYDDEINDNFTMIVNTALMAGMALNAHSVDGGSTALVYVLCLGIVVSLIRYILDKSIKTPIYVMPVFILASSLSGQLVILLSALYVFLSVMIYVFHKNKITFSFVCLFAIPFIDNSVMNTTVVTLASKAGSIDPSYVYWSVLALALIALLKFFGSHLIASFTDIKYRQPLEILAFIAIALAAGFSGYKLSSPIPLFCVIPFAVLEARYFDVISKIRADALLPYIERVFKALYKFKQRKYREAYIGSKHMINDGSSAAGSILRAALVWSALFARGCTLLTKKVVKRSTSCFTRFIDSIMTKTGTEEIIAILSAILILLIFLWGDK